MNDVTLWLKVLGLEKYTDAFAENEIDFVTLPELTEGDLKELGLPIGPRRRRNRLKLRGSSPVRCGDRRRRGCSERPRSPRKWLVLCCGREEAADLGEPCGKGAAEDGDELVGLARKEDPEELCDGEEVQNPHAEAKPDNEEDHDKAADPHVARCRLAVGPFRFHGRLRRYQLRAAYYTSGSPR